MAAGFNSFDGGFNATQHSGRNARAGGGEIISGYLAVVPGTGQVLWVYITDPPGGNKQISVDFAGNAYITHQNQMRRIALSGVTEWVLPLVLHAGVPIVPAVGAANGAWANSGVTRWAIEADGNVVGPIALVGYDGPSGEQCDPGRQPIFGVGERDAFRQQIDGVYSVAWTVPYLRDVTGQGAWNPNVTGYRANVGVDYQWERSDRSAFNIMDSETGADTAYIRGAGAGHPQPAFQCVETGGNYWFDLRRWGATGPFIGPDLNGRQYLVGTQMRTGQSMRTDQGGNVFVVPSVGGGLVRVDPENGSPLWEPGVVEAHSGLTSFGALRFGDNMGGCFGRFGVGGNPVHIDSSGVIDRAYNIDAGLVDYQAGTLFIQFTTSSPVPAFL